MSRSRATARATSAGNPDASPIESRPGGSVHVHLKIVPGASTAGLAGRYGDRLKLRVTAAAESGKANKAVLALLAGVLQIPVQDVELVRGKSSPLKTVAVLGIAYADVLTRLEVAKA